jgi:2-oxoglutarate ferredoxin oxidoreductase subunit gamma
MKHEIRLSGTGGQGLILAGIILGEAAAIYENLFATQKQSYGPEARGGASRSDVIISDREIEDPEIIEPDILLTMSQEAYDRYAKRLRKGGILIVDKSLVSIGAVGLNASIYSIDFTRSARNIFNKQIVANIIALGAVINLLRVVSKESVQKILEKRIPSQFLSVNQRALDLGITLSKEVSI